MTYRIDPSAIRKALELILLPGQVTELRVLGCTIEGDRRSGTYSGYFDSDHIDDFVAACQRITRASACYFTPNPVKPELLARSYNRARMIFGREPTTSDHDIAARRWLLIDVDAKRPAGVSATLAEKAAAEGLITAIDYWLWEKGFPPGLIADSGNGAHLMIPVCLPAADQGWCERMLKGLAKEFDTPAATVDVTVHNPARIWKLYGTQVCKGDNCPEIGREWRMAQILQVCKTTEGDRPRVRS